MGDVRETFDSGLIYGARVEARTERSPSAPEQGVLVRVSDKRDRDVEVTAGLVLPFDVARRLGHFLLAATER